MLLFQKKRKQITKPEGAKKNKLTQEQTLFPEPSGTEIKKDENCLQTPLKPPPTPPSSFSIKVPLSYFQGWPLPVVYYWTPHNPGKFLTNPLL